MPTFSLQTKVTFLTFSLFIEKGFTGASRLGFSTKFVMRNPSRAQKLIHEGLIFLFRVRGGFTLAKALEDF